MHDFKRIITALIAAPVVLLTILYGSKLLFLLLVLAGTIVGLLEYYALAGKTGASFPVWLGVTLGCLLVGSSYSFSFPHVLGALVLIVLLSLSYYMLNYDSYHDIFQSVSLFITGIAYVALSFTHLVLLRHIGREWVLFLLFVVFWGDTGAYYTGKCFGRKKLYPSVSPGKTVEGAIGGLAVSIGMGYLVRVFYLPWLSNRQAIVMAATLGLAGQTGDLVESVIKRAVGVKDSGAILPGHGGVLDRMDGVIFAAPVLFYEVLFFLRA
ncbi:MAG: phosphatidate cytidylyltransferase [Pseudomonadota bacterium]